MNLMENVTTKEVVIVSINLIGLTLVLCILFVGKKHINQSITLLERC